MSYKIKKIKIDSLKDAEEEIRKIGSDPKSIEIMAPKAVFMTILIEGVHPVDAIIMKQDMLSIGGEVAVPKDVFERKEPCKVLVMGTLKQFLRLSEKLKMHHPRLKRIGELLDKELKVD